MLYVTTNRNQLKPKRIIFLPYLHERKIYLNQIELTHKFFYNVVVEQDIGDKDEAGDNDIHTLIFAINFTKFYYDVFTERGIQLRTVSFKDEVSRYGIPINVSSDGRSFIFQKPEKLFELHIICFTSRFTIHMKSINIKESIIEYAN